MSELVEWYDTTFSILRQLEVSGERKLQWTTVSSGELGLLTKITDPTKLYNQANMGKEYDLMCDSEVDLKDNDVIQVGTLKYGVLYVDIPIDREDGEETHMEARVNKRK